MILSDLSEIKSILEIDPDNTQEDKNLLFYVEWASEWIQELLGRPNLMKKSRTEYYGGSGTKYLALKSRPVYKTPTIEVYVDKGGYYGSVTDSFSADSALSYGRDFSLKLDSEDEQTSRSGLLVRINGIWSKRQERQAGFLSPFIGDETGSIKVTYTGGYTVDTLPAPLRMACVTLTAKMRYFFPLGMALNSESYEERNISVVNENKEYLLGQVKDLITPYRNWRF